MKYFLLPGLFLLLRLNGFAQLITTDPPIPVVNEAVTVIFNATEGSGGLAGYTGDVYAHTGVITQFSGGGSDWKYVKTNWGQNTEDTKMTRIGQDLYSLEIVPDVRAYYGVPQNEKIFQMAFVFRSGVEVEGNWLEGKTESGGDIFIDVFEAGLSVTFSLPEKFPVILPEGESFITEVNANEADTVSLFINDELIKKIAGNVLKDTITISDYGKYIVKAIAANDTGMVTDSFFYYGRPPVTIEALPAGIRDGINYIGEETTVLSLMAPYKEFVYVIGDFNDWDINVDYFMKRTPDSKYYWLEIDGLVPGKEYIFQYFIDGVIRIGDPYADKISDPWNDSFISNNTYPDLIAYPEGKTTGIATVLQTNQPAYPWEVEQFTPAAITDLVIYELLVRDFTTQHSYAALVDTLGYLEKLGVNAIELMPVSEFEGNVGWGYNPSFYFAPDKYYGPKNELKRFIDECHKRGIAVLIDLVLNHSYNQSPLVQMYFDGSKPTALNPWYNVNSNFQNPDAQWGNDFNHESLYTQALVDSINSFWMSEYKFDGFRFDFTKGFSNTPHGTDDSWGSNYDADRIRLLKRMTDEIWERNPDAIVIFEHLAENSEEKELAEYGILLWGNLNYTYNEAAMGWNDGGKSDFSWINYKKRTWNQPHLVGYMESHDEERLAYKCVTWGNSNGWYDIKDTNIAMQRLAMNALFFLTVPGPKMIWQFGELGYDYSIEYNGRLGVKPVRWDYLSVWSRNYLYNFYSILTHLRTENPAFETTDFTLSVASSLKKIVLESENMDVVVLGNFGVTPGNILPGFTHIGTWFEYFTGDTLEVEDVEATLYLIGGEYRLYTDVQLTSPEINTGVKENHDEGRLMRVYPNPADVFTIEIRIDEPSRLQLTIWDLFGNMIASVFNGYVQQGIYSYYWPDNGTDLSSGIYFVDAKVNDQVEGVKVVLR